MPIGDGLAKIPASKSTAIYAAAFGFLLNSKPGARMSDPKYKVVELSSLKFEDGAHELASSPEMQPYMKLAEAVVLGSDPTAAMEAIRQLPLEERYVWRVASALKWGFADFDDLGISADKQTLGPDDLAKLMNLLKLRPMQFCMLLRALVGADQMERTMLQAIGFAKQG